MAVVIPHKGSIIACLLIKGLSEWVNKLKTFFPLNNKFSFSVKMLKLVFKTRRPKNPLSIKKITFLLG